MKPTVKIFSIYLFILFLILTFSSCNSVKRVLRDPVKFEKVAREVVKAGYCVNDTIVTSKDSIVYKNKDSLVYVKIPTKCPDFDTTLVNGSRVISKDGQLSVTVPVKTVEKVVTRTITNSIRDKKLETILKEERDSLQLLYNKALLDIKSAKTDLRASELELGEAKRKNLFTWIGIGVLALVLGFLKFKKYIPFI